LASWNGRRYSNENKEEQEDIESMIRNRKLFDTNIKEMTSSIQDIDDISKAENSWNK
jgi:hypothetical protein